MGNLLNFAVYNPAILKEDDFLAGFIARQALAESLLQGLKRLEPDGPAKHRLILGQRGMGKTSLLRRIALGVAQDEELSARFLPLSFREEQYNVHNLRTFWNNCLDALGDCLEKAGRTEQAEAVDADIAKLERSRDPEGEEACRLFKDWCKREGKRPLLLLDNIDIILDGLAKQDWAFRRILQERGGAVVFGATVNPLEATAKIEGAFYDFFQVTVLEKLSFPELTDCLRQLAAQRGEDGKKVQRVLNRDIGRIHTLYDFTGGNPRTLVLLYLLLELDSEEDVMTDLERLLDQVSVLYKARVEDLAPQARVVLDAVALNWNPATVATIRDITGLETGSIAAQLDRLQKNGVIEKTALSTPTAAGYQLGERLFNIWYLMRHGQRRQRNRLRWLSEFLRGFYGPDGLRDMARGVSSRAVRNGLSGGMYSLAMREAVDEPVLQRLLGHHATSQFERHAEETRTALRSFIDLEDLDGETHTMAELKKAVLNCQREWPEGTSAEEFWDLLGGSLEQTQQEKCNIVRELPGISNAGILAFFGLYRLRTTHWNQETGLPTSVEQLSAAFRDGLVHDIHDLVGVAAAIQRGDDPRILLLAIGFCTEAEIRELPSNDLDYALDRLRQFNNDDIDGASNIILHNYGWLLKVAGDFDGAEKAYRKAVSVDPEDAGTWNDLGVLLRQLRNYNDALYAFLRATSLAHDNVGYWFNLGLLLHYNLYDNEKAEQAYREAIKLDPNNDAILHNFGYLLHIRLRRHEEAEQVYRKCIDLNPRNADAYNNLGVLLSSYLSRYEDAELAYRKAIEVDNKFIWPRLNLGILLGNHFHRFEEAEKSYRDAIKLDPNYADSWNGLGILLADGFNRLQEAEQAYRQCLELDQANDSAKANLAYLLLSQKDRLEEAETFCQQALAKLPVHGGALLRAYRALILNNIKEGIQAFAEAINSDAEELFIDYLDDMLRVLRLAAKLGHGEKLLAWFDESGVGERYWPLRAGFEAYLYGEAKLRDVNPEVRAAASRIYASLDRLRAGQLR